MKNQFERIAAGAALALMLALGGCAAPAGSGNAALLQQADSVLRQATPGAVVTAALSQAEIKVGDSVGLTVSANAAGYVYVYQLSSDGKTVDVIFPNAVDGANYLPGGNLSLPRANWKLTAQGPAGLGYFLTVLAAQQQDLVEITRQAQTGKIAINGPYAASMTTLREVAP